MSETNGKWYESSAGTGYLAATIKGILIGVLPLLVLASRAVGVEIGSEELQPIINTIEGLVIAIGGVISIVITLFGLIRKVVIRFRNR